MAKRKTSTKKSKRTTRNQSKKQKLSHKFNMVPWVIAIVVVLLIVLLVVAPTGKFVDTDGDGLPANLEKIFGSDPSNPDTDGDGCLDGDEYKIYNTDLLEPDCPP